MHKAEHAALHCAARTAAADLGNEHSAGRLPAQGGFARQPRAGWRPEEQDEDARASSLLQPVCNLGYKCWLLQEALVGLSGHCSQSSTTLGRELCVLT